MVHVQIKVLGALALVYVVSTPEVLVRCHCQKNAGAVRSIFWRTVSAKFHRSRPSALPGQVRENCGHTYTHRASKAEKKSGCLTAPARNVVATVWQCLQVNNANVIPRSLLEQTNNKRTC